MRLMNSYWLCRLQAGANAAIRSNDKLLLKFVSYVLLFIYW